MLPLRWRVTGKSRGIMRFFAEEKIERLLRDIKDTIYRETYPIASFKFAEADVEGAQHPDFDDSDWQIFKPKLFPLRRQGFCQRCAILRVSMRKVLSSRPLNAPRMAMAGLCASMKVGAIATRMRSWILANGAFNRRWCAIWWRRMRRLSV